MYRKIQKSWLTEIIPLIWRNLSGAYILCCPILSFFSAQHKERLQSDGCSMAGILFFLSSTGLTCSPSLVSAIADDCDILCLLIRQEIFHFSRQKNPWWKIMKFLNKDRIQSCTCTTRCHSLHPNLGPFRFGLYLKCWHFGTSLVAQWWRICLPIQGSQVQSLIQEDPTWQGATGPMQPNYWACAPEPGSHHYWAHVPKPLKAMRPRAHAPQVKPLQWAAWAPQLESGPLLAATKESPHAATKTQHQPLINKNRSLKQ